MQAESVAARRFDLICLGRAAVDLYSEQLGCRLEDTASFAKYVGGCAGNIAIGCARQGLRVAMLSRVGDEQMGRFVRETLVAEGVDVSHLSTDDDRMTGLAILGIRDRDTFPLLFYRENCADMAISPGDFAPEFIASARALLVTGTHFSTPDTDRVSRTAIFYARKHGVTVVFDIDYRPVLWGLTGKAMGEIRYVESDTVCARLQSVAALADLVVGTEEEIHIAAGVRDTLGALRVLRGITAATLVLKLGRRGCAIFPGEIPPRLEDGLVVPGLTVEVLTALGAGDAFMSGFLRGWLEGEPLQRCGYFGNICGALVASRHGCSPAMPTRREVDAVVARAGAVDRPDLDTALDHAHWAATRRGRRPELLVLAFDHRAHFEALADACGAGRERIVAMKALIAQAVRRVAATEPGRVGILVDSRYGRGVLESLVGEGLWVGRPVELPGSRPLVFEAGINVGLEIRRWPRNHVVKCLVRYHPDEPPALRGRQEGDLFGLFQACRETGHELLVEVVLPPELPAWTDTLARALGQIYDSGTFPDWWKLQATLPEAWAAVAAVVEGRDPACRGVLVLGLDASAETLRRNFLAVADLPVVKGFAVGRTIFGEPCGDWLAGKIDDAALVDAVAAGYRQLIALWRQCRQP